MSSLHKIENTASVCYSDCVSNPLQLMFLPPYSPQLNVIDGLWGWLKKSVIYNVFYHKVNDIRKAVQDFIANINKTPMKTVDRLCIQL